MVNKYMSIEVTRYNRYKGIRERLWRFLFSPTPLAPLPVRANNFACRLANHPIDLVTHLGIVRANAYFAVGCPVELCDHAAARDLWNLIHHDVINDNQN